MVILWSTAGAAVVTEVFFFFQYSKTNWFMLFVPVVLQGQKVGAVTSKFVGFSVSVESANPSGGNAGTFHLYGDSTIQFSLACPNTVTHATTSPKSEAKVFWTAPPQGSGCVNFR